MRRAFRFGSLRVVAALILVVFAAVVSLGSAGTAQAQDSSVDIVDFAFDSSSITVEVGSTVTWTNVGAATHTVTADDGTFDSGDLASDETFSFTFDEPGTYTYHCGIHPDMTGEIVVVDSSAGDDTGDDDTGDDTAGDDDAALPSTGAGTTATTGVPHALLALAVVLAASGLLATRRRPAR